MQQPEAGVVHAPYWEERGERWGHDMAHIKPSGSGSISTLAVDDEEIRNAERRRLPLGFRAPEAHAQPTSQTWGESLWVERGYL